MCLGNCWQDASNDESADEENNDASSDGDVSEDPDDDAVMESTKGESLVFTRSDDTTAGESPMMSDQDLGLLGSYCFMFWILPE